jgi:hypothetical protein
LRLIEGIRPRHSHVCQVSFIKSFDVVTNPNTVPPFGEPTARSNTRRCANGLTGMQWDATRLGDDVAGRIALSKIHRF